MIDWFNLYPITSNKTYLISSNQSYTYKEIEHMINELIKQMEINNLPPGSRVAILLNNSLEYILIIFCLIKAQIPIIFLNSKNSLEVNLNQLSDGQATHLISSNEFVPKDSDLITSLSNFNSLTLLRIANSDKKILKPLAPNTQFILFTSGTSGKSKATQLTLENFYQSALTSSHRLKYTEKDSWVLTLPLYHVGGLSIVLRSLIFNMTVVLVDQFDLKTIKEVSEQNSPSIISLVPTMLHRILISEKPEYLRSYRVILVGGARTPNNLIKLSKEHNLNIFVTYGMTEASSQVATAIPEEVFQDPETVGMLLEKLDAKLVNKIDENVGELCIKGPQVMRGYFNESFSGIDNEGWFNTGDLASISDNGFLYIQVRRTDLIVCGGENIYPKEIERFVLGFKDIEDCLVFGLPDAEWGQIVAMAIETQMEMDLSDLKSKIGLNLGTFKKPRRIYSFKIFPRFESGKLDTSKLLKLIKNKNQT